MTPDGTQQKGCRRRWPWVLGAFAALLILLGAAGALYNLYWQHKVDALLASYRARGEPATWQEVLSARSKLPADRNSALVFQGAFSQLLGRDESAGNALDALLASDKPGARPSGRTLALLRARLKAQAPILATIRKGAALETGFYPLKSAGSPHMTLLPYMDGMHAAIGLCAREAEVRALDGDSAGAAAALVDALRLCASLGPCWILVEESGRTSFDETICKASERVLGLCRVPPEALERLREEMAREESELSLRYGLIGERALGHYTFTQDGAVGFLDELGVRPDPATEVKLWLYDEIPGLRSKDELFYDALLDRCIRLAGLPLRSQLEQVPALNAKLRAHRHPFRHTLSEMLLPAFTHAFRKSDDVRVLLRVTETALAVEQWRVQHGRWPDRLGDLPPEVLKSLPEDPYSGKPMRYSRTGQGVAVSSAGEGHNAVPPMLISGIGSNGEVSRMVVPQKSVNLSFRLLDPASRGTGRMTFQQEVRKAGLGPRELEALGLSAVEVRSLGLGGQPGARGPERAGG